MLQVFFGAIFALAWRAAAAVWARLSLMGGVMTNDSGDLAVGRHAKLLAVMASGEALAALAGPVAAVAIVSANHRGALLQIFAALLVAGGLLQIYAWRSFFKDRA